MMIKEATPVDLIEEGHTLLQKDDIDGAYLAYKMATLHDGASPSDLCRAHQQAGVCARLQGKLEVAKAHLEAAETLTKDYNIDTVLVGAVLRDLGALYATMYHSFQRSFRGYHMELADKYLASARRAFEESERILDDAQAPIHERFASRIYANFLEWQAAHEEIKDPEKRDEQKAQYRAMLESDYWYVSDVLSARSPLDDTARIYQANMLIRVVRTLPLAARLKHRSELMRLTAPNSPSPGARKRALVALAFGDRVYSWFELRQVPRPR